jgi:hypothetical protein
VEGDVIYPHYTVWKDHVRGHFEVVKWPGPDIAVVVQTNIKTRAKAEEACKIWQARAALTPEQDK